MNATCDPPREQVVSHAPASKQEEAAVIEGLPGVTTFDPWPTLCTADTCSALKEGAVVYSDASHLNQAGSQLFVAPLRGALSKIVEST